MWVKNQGTANLTGVPTRGQLPTLIDGTYTGIFVSVTRDAQDKQWITVSSSNGAHVEQNDMDVSQFKLNDRIEFTIKSAGGAGLRMKGTKFQLVADREGEPLTSWTDLDTIYAYVKENDVKLAGPRLESITLAPPRSYS